MENNAIIDNKLMQDQLERAQLEERDAIDAIIPPTDIVAFTEQRSCADIYRMYDKGQLDINPDFQRGEVWSNKAQTVFIDSLLKQLPIPSMCISLDIVTQKRLVIDGLQRITSIVKFLDNKTDWRLSTTNNVDKRLSGRKTSVIRMSDDSIYDIIENVTIPITILRCDYSKSEHMKYLFQIFYRLNSGGNRLFNQEIRNCIFQGNFNTLLKELAISEQWLSFANTTEERVRKARFSNEERILRFFAFYYSYEKYSGKLAGFLNDYMEENQHLSDIDCDIYRNLFIDTLAIAQYLGNRIESKNVADAILVGIAKNREYLKTDSIIGLYDKLMLEPEFATEELQEGLSATDKVKSRIDKAIKIFGNG